MNKYILGITALIALSACTNQKKEVSEVERPNIILIMADDVAPEHFSCYGGEIPTPNIDRLASEGLLFHRAYAPSAACTPSRYSIMTGQFPGRCLADTFTRSFPKNGIYKIAWNTPITEQNLTIHELMSQGGYFTGFVGKFHIGDLNFSKPEHNTDIPRIDPDINPEDPLCDSILKIHQAIVSERVKELTGCTYAASIQWENPEELPVKAIRKHNLEWITSGADEFLNEWSGNRPFFLHFNTTAFHGPNHHYDLLTPAKYTAEGIMQDPYKYHPPRESIFKRLIELGIDTGKNQPDHIRHYNTGKLYLDDQVGAIMKMVEEKGIKDNTIIILTADHAIEPGKSTCYERGLRVPFIVSWPNMIENPGQTSEMVLFSDFLPTFAEIAGIKTNSLVNIDGVSFLPVLKGNDIPDREYIYTEEGYTRAVSNEKYKYIAMRFPKNVQERILNGESDIITHFGDQFQAHGIIASKYHEGYFDADQLYDLENDPWEQNNLVKKPEYRDILKEMQEKLSFYTSKMPGSFPVDNSSFKETAAYNDLVEKTRMKGTEDIYWWKRELIYPPDLQK